MKNISFIKFIFYTLSLTFIFSGTSFADTPITSAGNRYGVLKIDDYLNLLPKKYDGVIRDVRLVDRVHAGVRVFRLYNQAPMHYHAKSDAFLYILSGKGEFYLGNEKNKIIAQKGDMLFWEAGTPHGYGKLLEGPYLEVLVFDAVARDPNDVVWSDPATSPQKFLAN